MCVCLVKDEYDDELNDAFAYQTIIIIIQHDEFMIKVKLVYLNILIQFLMITNLNDTDDTIYLIEIP